MYRLRIAILLSLLFSTKIYSQQYRPLSSSQVYEQLQALQVLGTVMYIAAHPDDENTRLLSYLVHHNHVNTIYLSLTRGDGGQNILGNEQGSALGLIRTHELIEARKIDGASQLFTPVIDFGFTKTPEETFKFWDRKALIKNIKEAIELHKPDVLICRFPTTGEGGHGQHTVSAIVAEDAYSELLNDKQAKWIPTRLLFNAFRFGNRNTTDESQFKLPINQYNSLLGEGYGEMAGRSRSVHKSQGAGTPQSVGISNEYFKLLAGKEIQQSIYDDIDLSWGRVGRRDIGNLIASLINNFDFVQPKNNLPRLLHIRKQIATVDDAFWKLKKMKAVDELILSCAGIMAEVLTTQQTAIAGASIPVSLNLVSRADSAVLQSVSFKGYHTNGNQGKVQLQADSLYKFSFEGKLTSNLPITEPYWLANSASVGSYNYSENYKGLPQTPNELYATLQVQLSGEIFEFEVPLSYKYLDPIKGDVVQQLRIVPNVSVVPVQNLLVFENGKNATVDVRLSTYAPLKNAQIQLTHGSKMLTKVDNVTIANNTDTLYQINIPEQALSALPDGAELKVSVVENDKVFDRELHLIQYPHLPDLQYFSTAKIKLVQKRWKVAVSKIGYIKGAGDFVDATLSLLGLQVDQVQEAELNDAQALLKYETIVLGVRAINTQQKMNAWMPVLLRYVELGGTLVVQYNTNQNLKTDVLGPHPFSLSRERVTEEDAEVTFTNPSARLVNFPNRLLPSDFDNWVQERGIYFPDKYEQHYQTLFAMNDTNEKPLNSAVIYTPFGKGQFIYTSLVFFRQLPAGNTGAIRLMMNLLSAGK